MTAKSFNYFALVSREKSPGVAKKIDNTVIAASNIGLKAHGYCYPTSLNGVKSFFKALFKNKADFVMIRYSDLVSPIVFLLMIFLRLRGAKVIIDVPTPRVIGLQEIDTVVKNKFLCFLRKSLMICTGGWVFYPAHRIVQYANESWWFELGVKKKTLKIGNGILIDDQLPLVQSVWPAEELKLIGVAQLANWHGYDRLIRALAVINEQALPYKVSFTIVGDGHERPALETLVKQLGLEDQVIFTGMLTGKKLDEVFSDKHIGVASLGLYRIGLEEASVLKTREYIARGLPVIGVGEDPDFEKSSQYRFRVANDDNFLEIVKLLSAFSDLNFVETFKFREYAVFNLSLESKLKVILNV